MERDVSSKPGCLAGSDEVGRIIMSEVLLTVENLSKSYGEKELFHQISFGISKGQKIGLVARNGVGKTSLLEIIAGNDIHVAYLSQNPVIDENLSVIEFIFSSDNESVNAVKEYETALLQAQLSNSLQNQEMLNQCILKMDSLGAWDYENKIKEILSRLQVGDVTKKINQLSGGERRKMALSKALIEKTDLLILDEPTNHLDISMIEWLEDFLSKQNLALLIVTHDRYFLDNVCNEILELSDGALYK